MKNPLTTFLLLLFTSFALFAQPGLDSAGLNRAPTVFTFVERAPEFPGGDAGLIGFLQQNIVYPSKAVRDNIQGRVLVRFVVMEDGKVSDPAVVQGVSPELDAEAIRVIRLLPDFKPGMQQGKAVKVYYNLPISFKLSEPAKKKKKRKK